MAARWRNKEGDGSIFKDGRYWTPGTYASGATDSYQNKDATMEVAWFDGVFSARPVDKLRPNDLGVYDMCGNVAEWIYATNSFQLLLVVVIFSVIPYS